VDINFKKHAVKPNMPVYQHESTYC